MSIHRPSKRANPANRTRRRGAVLIYVAFLLPVLLGFAALAIDIGYMQLWRTRCQTAADAAARAGAQRLMQTRGDFGGAREAAITYAEANLPDGGSVLVRDDVIFGTWNSTTRTFVAGGSSPNAIQVFVRRAQSNGNPLSLFFARVWGHAETDVSATAIALIPSSGPRFRFLIDNEFIDTGYKPIVDLANSYNPKKSPEDLINDRDGDGWIDLPVGWRAWLPTGQVGDEAFFDRTAFGHYFPFKGQDSTYSTLDFLVYNTNMQLKFGGKNLDVTWKSSDLPAPHTTHMLGKKVLDPVPGIQRVNTAVQIEDLVDPDAVWVSPIYKSDISQLNSVTWSPGVTVPMANALGERRSGLIAFRILASSRTPPAGYSSSSGSLPWVYIEIVDGNKIDLRQVARDSGIGGSSGTPHLVR